jgi:type IV secretion system protein VirB4
MTTGRYFRNTHSLSIAYTPESGVAKFFEKIGYHMTVGGKKVYGAIIEAAKDTVLSRSAFAFDMEQIRSDTRRFEAMLDAFTGGVPRIKPTRLAMQESYEALHQIANPSVPKRRIRFPVTLLDTHLSESEITVGAERLLFESAHGKRYAAIVAVKEWMSFRKLRSTSYCRWTRSWMSASCSASLIPRAPRPTSRSTALLQDGCRQPPIDGQAVFGEGGKRER